MKHCYPLLLLPLLFPATLAVAQSAGVHVAPGKPLRVQRGLPPPYVPVKEPIILPRYWSTLDSAQRVADYQRLARYLSYRIRYPVAVVREIGSQEIPTGRFSFRLLVNPDGSIQLPRLTARALTLAESAYNPALVEALETEAKRVLSTMRFVPAGKVDTLTVPITFTKWW